MGGCGFFFPLQVPPDEILCAMKLSALLSRHKGRDFYDSMFLLQQTEPCLDFLKALHGIKTKGELKKALLQVADSTNLNIKKRDFEHLLFNVRSSEKNFAFQGIYREPLVAG